MTGAQGQQPVVQVAHRLPGRVRFRIDIDERGRLTGLPRALHQPGILDVRVEPLTGSVLVRYDAQATTEEAIRARIERALRSPASSTDTGTVETAPHPPAKHRLAVDHRVVRLDSQGHRWQRVRLRVTGLEGNHTLARELETRLQELGVHVARASVATGRLLLEHDSDAIALESILEVISGISLPEEPPTLRRTIVPTDRGPLVYAAWRTGATAVALGALAARQLLGGTGPLTASPIPRIAADAVTVARGFPTLREGLRRLLGPANADIATSSVSIVSQTANNQQLGLLVSLTEALRIVSALLPWRRAWQRYESELLRTSIARPGQTLTLRAGSRVPFDGRVERGTAEVLLPDGRIGRARPQRHLPAGSLLLDGEVSVHLEPPPVTESFASSEPGPPLLRRYLQVITPLAFAYAGVAGLVARSLAAAARALVLVNARTALIGTEAADLGAVARALRGGALVTALRPGRRLTRPTVIVLDHPGLLGDGLELDRCFVLDAGLTTGSVLALAADAARQTPWQTAFPPVRGEANGLSPHEVRLTRADASLLERLTAEQRTTLASALVTLALVRRPDEPLAVLSLRPRLRAHVETLRQGCGQAGVRLLVRLPDDRRPAWLETLGLETVEASDPVELVRELRARGETVFYVADHGRAVPAFAAAHYSGLLFSTHRPLDVPVDVLLPDLGALAALVETARRRDAAVRDSVVVSFAANALALGVGLGATPSPILVSLVVGGGAFLALVAGWVRLWGGERQTTLPFVDPEPERWGALSPA
ncbi:MAG: heavy metal translocating P-type ATPase, partial [Thermomicrobium sp.]|nr:heavy metal translocating P-type ATPase [Thermomicrobium sp.]